MNQPLSGALPEHACTIDALQIDLTNAPESSSVAMVELPGPLEILGVVERASAHLGSAHDAYQSLGHATEVLTGGLPGCSIGVLLADAGELRVAAASSSSLPALMCVDIGCHGGPAHTAYRTGRPSSSHVLPGRRFGDFDRAAMSAGFRSAYGLPIADNGRLLGALLVLVDRPHAFDAAGLGILAELARAMAAALRPPNSDRHVWTGSQAASHEMDGRSLA